jgi:hypothetical protein
VRFFRLPALLLFLLILVPAAARAQSPSAPPLSDQPDSDSTQDASTHQSLSAQVAAWLISGDYDQIDRKATQLRKDKTRLPAGGWELPNLYAGLKAPDGAHPEDHIARLNAWIAARPKSITPRVALASVYLTYAWKARGNGSADTVTDEGWRLFAERAAQAAQVLYDAANITPMCPEWYSKVQKVALAQNWDRERTEAVFQKAIQFEPNYIYFYKAYALYLLPKWDGEKRDAAAFAQRSADAIGGAEGDFMYFQIGMEALDAKSGEKGAGMDWARLQRGYQAQRNLYQKNTVYDTNQLAFFAWRFHDRAVAAPLFDQIGEKWSKRVWKTRTHFDEVRAWANQTATPTASAN